MEEVIILIFSLWFLFLLLENLMFIYKLFVENNNWCYNIVEFFRYLIRWFHRQNCSYINIVYIYAYLELSFEI